MRGLAPQLQWFCAALLALAMPTSAAADPPQNWQWNVDYGQRRCSLIRLDEPTRSRIFAVQTVPGSGNYQARLIARHWPLGAVEGAERLSVSLQPGGANLTGDRRVEHSPLGEVVVTYLHASPLDALEHAGAIRVQRGHEIIFEIPLANTAQAVAAFRQCTQSLLREWGIDPAIYERIREGVRPDRPIASIVSDADYPPSAVHDNFAGEVVVRLTIDTDGRISECVPVVSSGHVILDNRTCEIFRQRLHFTPAIGMDGQPIAIPLVSGMRWELPRQ